MHANPFHFEVMTLAIAKYKSKSNWISESPHIISHIIDKKFPHGPEMVV